jgi:hypothetical protein
MFSFDGVTITHFIRGRVRLRITHLKKNEDLADKVRNYASGMDLVENLEINTLTGSILVEYDPEKKEDIKKLFKQAKQFNLIPDEIKLEDIHQILEGKKHPADFAEQVRFFFKQINNEVKTLTGNRVGLNDLVPIGLLGLGIRSLMAAEALTGPPWHTYFWYAFSSFLIFNPSNSNSDGQNEENELHAASG